MVDLPNVRQIESFDIRPIFVISE